ncbi:mitochondrial carrier protein [Nitzschia inconspicua]|uniref:Mitochondrial carrier protein n=1 Tax=Nitzschia inconspicua TaxID=303405 RepID=A0A9K3LX78_9STRA|nr:mitochondrial carrier protein [Nitzschia inconspicua]
MSDVSLVASLLGLAPGAVGGFCSVAVGHPIDLIKVRQQTAAQALSESTIGMLRGIFVQEGVSGLYRGVAAPLMAVTPAFAISFWSYDLAGRAIRSTGNVPETQALTTSQVALAGAWSGVPLAIIFGPTDRIKCLMQVDSTGKYRNFTDCFLKTYQDGGIRSVFRGTGSCALRDVPGNAAYFGAYEYVKRLSCQLEGREQASTFGTLVAGGCAGVANWIVAIPVDTLKSRLQTAPSGTYNGLFDVFQTLVRTEGPTALFRGLSPALLRAFPANAACLCGVETVKGMLEGR